MHFLIRLMLLLAAASSPALLRSESLTPDLSAALDSRTWRVHNRTASAIPDRPNAIRLNAQPNDGATWLADSDFHEGTIEIELRGQDVPQQSFVGIAFRGASDETYDAIYFRPFNFKAPDPRRARAVQYVSMPQFPWQKLREAHPGKYEAAIAPVPDPSGWFRVRIVLENGKVSVFVNDATSPCLVVDELSSRRGGQIGLWVGNNSPGDFASLKLTSPTPKS